jgi:hypothetical protein
MVTSQEVEKYIDNNIGKDNFCFLSGYLRYSSSARLQCAEIILDAYKRLQSKEIGKGLDQDAKNNLKGALTIDMLSKVMMSIEDLGAVIIALSDLNNFTNIILDTPPGKARNIYKELIKKDNTFYFNLFTYPNLDSLPVQSQDKDLLKTIYDRNITIIKKLFTKIIEFVAKHKRAFLKSKHGYPILTGMENANLSEGIDMIVPVLYKNDPDPKSTIVLSGLKVNELYFRLIKTIIQLMKDLLLSKVEMINCAGNKLPLLNSYCQLSEDENRQIAKINTECSGQNKKPEVNVNIVIQYNKSYLAEMLEFFNEKWDIEG